MIDSICFVANVGYCINVCDNLYNVSSNNHYYRTKGLEIGNGRRRSSNFDFIQLQFIKFIFWITMMKIVFLSSYQLIEIGKVQIVMFIIILSGK